LWGGRFDRAPDELFYQFQRSFSFDRRLLAVRTGGGPRVGGRARIGRHSFTEEMRRHARRRSTKLPSARQAIRMAGCSPAEDVHHFVETALVEYLGPLGYKLHTGRSRNELVATDFRMFVKEAAAEMRVPLLRA
jgi:argininosuccinate lyase